MMKSQVKIIHFMNYRDITKIRVVSHMNLFNQIISKTNLLDSWQEFKSCKRNKLDVQVFESDLAENLLALYFDLKDGTYKHGSYSSFYIHDPKLRHIHKASVRDRVLHHAIMKQIEPYFERIFIFDSYSSRVDKGTHKAILRLKNFAWKLSRNNTKIVWALKCDIRKFFDSINHEILFGLIQKEISDKATLELIREVIDSFPARLDINSANIADTNKGTPLGNLTSQLFSNIYLNPLDQFVKQILKEKCYLRYADDFVILSLDREHLLSLVSKLQSFLKNVLDLELHSKKMVIRKWNQGIDFLGYVVFPHHIILRSKTKRRMFKNIRLGLILVEKGLMDEEKLKQSLNSYLGLLKHCRDKVILRNLNKMSSDRYKN